jgi:hypothetical protein
MNLFDQITEFFTRDDKSELEQDLIEMPDDASPLLVAAIEAELAALEGEQ